MKFTPHAAFGKVVILAQTNAGDTRVVPIAENGLVKTGWYYYTHGCAKVHVIETGEQLSDRGPGWLNSEHAGAGASTGGNLQLSVNDFVKSDVEEYGYIFTAAGEWLFANGHVGAYDREAVTLESVVVPAGESTFIKNDSNIFLVRGKLNIKGKVFVGPTQIRIRTGDVEATAEGTESCYGVKFL